MLHQGNQFLSKSFLIQVDPKQSQKPFFESRMTLEDMYNSLPKSLTKSEVLCSSRVIEDPDLIAQRQEMVRSKTPRELSQINALDDFPIPTKIETLIKKKQENNLKP